MLYLLFGIIFLILSAVMFISEFSKGAPSGGLNEQSSLKRSDKVKDFENKAMKRSKKTRKSLFGRFKRKDKKSASKPQEEKPKRTSLLAKIFSKKKKPSPVLPDANKTVKDQGIAKQDQSVELGKDNVETTSSDVKPIISENQPEKNTEKMVEKKDEDEVKEEKISPEILNMKPVAHLVKDTSLEQVSENEMKNNTKAKIAEGEISLEGLNMTDDKDDKGKKDDDDLKDDVGMKLGGDLE